MIKCQKCGADIVFIAIAHNKSVTCNADIIETYSRFGRLQKGYVLHKCEKGGEEKCQKKS